MEKNECTNVSLEETSDVVERGKCLVRKAVWSWNIFMSSLLDHLNGKTIYRKIGPTFMYQQKKTIQQYLLKP
jgi:hypothetical protein